MLTVRMALMKRGQSGRSGQTKCSLLEFHFFKVTCQITCRGIATPLLLKENREYFLATKALTQVPKVQTSSEVGHLGV